VKVQVVIGESRFARRRGSAKKVRGGNTLELATSRTNAVRIFLCRTLARLPCTGSSSVCAP
jgi:hypothetical protein